MDLTAYTDSWMSVGEQTQHRPDLEAKSMDLNDTIHTVDIITSLIRTIIPTNLGPTMCFQLIILRLRILDKANNFWPSVGVRNNELYCSNNHRSEIWTNFIIHSSNDYSILSTIVTDNILYPQLGIRNK